MTKIEVDIKALLDEERKKHKAVVENLNCQIRELQGMVLYERERREYAENKLAELDKPKRKRRTKAEIEAERADGREYSELKSNGVRKKTAMDCIKSYTDFKNIQDYFLKKGQINHYAIWTLGVCMGLRASDIVSLKWKNVINDDLSFKERVKIYEKKTDKLQNCLITEAMQEALTKVLNNMQWKFDMDGYIFPSDGKPGCHITRDCCYKNLVKAANASNIEYHIGTHTMRKSFINIVLCIDRNTIDMNAITKAQGLLNHSDPRVTMKYLGKLNEMYDKARIAVSDFVLGKTDVDQLVCGDSVNITDIIDKLNDIESKIGSC